MGPIAVFDSGVGGLSVLRELVAQMPSEHFFYFGDSANAPYGTRPTAEIRSLTLAHAERLFDRGAKALGRGLQHSDIRRHRRAARPLAGPGHHRIEPALKLAVSRHPGGCIGVLATEATLREEKFAALLQRCAENCHILKCPCPELVEFVERGELTGPALERCLAARLAPVLAAGPGRPLCWAAPTFPSPPEPSAVWWGRTSSCWTAARARRARQSAACWTRGCWCSRARAA